MLMTEKNDRVKHVELNVVHHTGQLPNGDVVQVDNFIQEFTVTLRSNRRLGMDDVKVRLQSWYEVLGVEETQATCVVR